MSGIGSHDSGDAMSQNGTSLPDLGITRKEARVGVPSRSVLVRERPGSRHLADNGVAISRRRIGQLRGASAVMTALRSFGTAVPKLPTTERQLRPLVRNELSAQEC